MVCNDADIESSIEAAITRLDLPGKVRLLSGAGMFDLPAEPAIGLAAVRMSDGPSGVRGERIVGGRPGAVLPNATLLAQTWDPGAVYEAADILADEAIDQQTHVVLGPTINLHRSLLGGRLFEAFSEDPYLTGVMGARYVAGLQDKNVSGSLKHYLGNESEVERFTMSSDMDERTLREVYLLPFEMVVEDANPWTIMASYNRVNGIAATEHQPLMDILKQQWGYDGVVVSDWHATNSTASSCNAGLDLVMPGIGSPWGDRLVEAVEAGEVAESTVDEHLRRVLRFATRVGAFGGDREWAAEVPRPDSAHRREQLRRLAAAGMTVLMNRDATLPLTRPQEGGPRKVAVIGRHATDTVIQGGGSAKLRPPHVVNIAEGLMGALGPEHVVVVEGVETRNRPTPASPARMRDPETGEPGIRVTARDASGQVLETVHLDVTELDVTDGDDFPGAETLELSAELVLEAPAPMRIGVRGPGTWELEVDDRHFSLEVRAWEGPGGGVFRPRGETVDVEVRAGTRITAVTRRMEGTRIIGLALQPRPRAAAAAIAEAVRAARQADIAIVAVGLTDEQDTEGQDKTTLKMPGQQDALVTAVAAAARKTVVVVNAATPVLMPWIEEVDAVLFVGLPGQEAGDAVAAAIVGDIEPAGRLVSTFPAQDGQGPAWSTTPKNGHLVYADGVAVGYRGWHGSGDAPQFWFGHGLGYTTWAYDQARVESQDGNTLNTVSVQVTNTGQRRGREVVQVYRAPRDPNHPVRLIGWTALELNPGESATTTVTCDPRPQRVWDTEHHSWSTPGPADLLIARGLGDVRCRMSL